MTGNSNPSKAFSLASLDAAYRATSYVAHLPEADEVLRVDGFSAPLDAYLQKMSVREWALISACNPGSKLLSDSRNRQRHQALIKAVNEQSYQWLPAEGIPDEPGWKPELSLIIFGIDLQNACALAAKFEQIALLAGAQGQPARLIYLNRN